MHIQKMQVLFYGVSGNRRTRIWRLLQISIRMVAGPMDCTHVAMDNAQPANFFVL